MRNPSPSVVRSSSARSNSPMNASKRYVSPHEQRSADLSPQQSKITYQQPNFGGHVQPITATEQSIINAVDQSKISNLTQFSNYLYVPCPSHPDLFITNFCYDIQCYEPLCPECITSHIEMHQQKGLKGRVENIQKVRKDQSSSVEKTIKTIQLKLAESKKYMNDYPLMYYQKKLEQLRNFHENVVDLVDSHFQTLYKQLKEQNFEHYKEELNSINQEGQKLLTTLHQLHDDIHNDTYVRAIIQISEQQQSLFNPKLLQRIEQLEKDMEGQQLQIVMDDSQLKHVEDNLRRFCYLTKTTQLQQHVASRKAPNNTPTPNEQQHYRYNPIEEAPIVKPSTLISEILFTEQKEIQINQYNHFDTHINKTIVKLEDDSKIAYIYGIGQQIMKETINGSQRIPALHRLITTRQGQHLVIGGINKDKARFKATAQVLEFNAQTLSLIPHSEMILPRALAAACQYEEYIYVVGGSTTNDENTSLAKAEKLNLTTRKWTSIADPQYKVSGCCLVQEGKHLFKIGGKSDIFTPCNIIELYNLTNDSWTTFDFKFQSTGYFRLPFNSCAVNIGHNQILIIGGSVHDVQSDETQILNIQEKSIRKSAQLPKAIEFNTQNCIIDNNHIYVLTDELKQVLVGSDQGWKFI